MPSTAILHRLAQLDDSAYCPPRAQAVSGAKAARPQTWPTDAQPAAEPAPTRSNGTGGVLLVERLASRYQAAVSML